jgi:hypothetical protein
MGGGVSTRERRFERLERSTQFHSFSLAKGRNPLKPGSDQRKCRFSDTTLETEARSNRSKSLP